MSRSINPIANSQNFDQWVAATNTIISVIGQTVTVAANNAGDQTTGNGFVTGIFGGTTLVATNLRGGNVASSDLLTVTSNIAMSGARADITGNLYVVASNTTFASNSSIVALHITGNSTSTDTTVSGNNLIISANTVVTGSFRLPPVTIATRPPGANGVTTFNTETGTIEVYSGNTWLMVSAFSNTLTASTISYNPSGSVSSLTVQGAITELTNEKVNLAGDSMTGALVVNTNGLALPASANGTVFQGAQLDARQTVMLLDAFANTTGFIGRRADGINSAKTTVQANDTIFYLGGIGYDGNTYSTVPTIQLDLRAAETFSNTNHGTKYVFRTTNVGASGTMYDSVVVSSANTDIRNFLTVVGNANLQANAVIAGYTQIGVLSVLGNVSSNGIYSGNGALLTSVDAVTLSGANAAFFGNAGNLTGSIPVSVLGSGTANTSTFLRGDQTWQVAAQYSINGVFTKAQRMTITTLTSAATVNADFSNSNYYTLTMGMNSTLGNPTNIVAGQTGSIEIKQDATGSRTLSYGTFWKFPSGLVPSLSTGANKVDRLDYFVTNTTFIHCSMALSIGG